MIRFNATRTQVMCLFDFYITSGPNENERTSESIIHEEIKESFYSSAVVLRVTVVLILFFMFPTLFFWSFKIGIRRCADSITAVATDEFWRSRTPQQSARL